MHPQNNSTSPPELDNPRGQSLIAAVSVVLVFMTIAIALRLWGRYRYTSPLSRTVSKAHYGESMFWILMSDIAVVLSYILSLTLTILSYVAVHWGEGLHIRHLSHTQAQNVLRIFFIYQVLYKFVSGIAKIATLFLLLAISMVQMRAFNLFCKCFALYIALYCVTTSVATVFQCGTHFDANWSKHGKEYCFELPPFWFAHAAINVSATAVMALLPWWLFSSITYKRKHAIAIIMSTFAIGETALGVVRLYGLYMSSHSRTDLTHGTVTGILVSQLEVDFACIAACIPTVLKMLEEFWVIFCVRVLGRTPMSWNRTDQGAGSSKARVTATSGHKPNDSMTLSAIRSTDRDPYSTGPYVDLGVYGGSMNSREHIIRAEGPFCGVQTQRSASVDGASHSGGEDAAMGREHEARVNHID